MSVIRETVCGINAQLDRLQQQTASSQRFDATDLSTESLESIGQLQDLINSISVTSKTQSLLSPNRLADLLSDTFSRLQVQTTLGEGNSAPLSDYVWIVTAKAAIQASGLVMNTLLDQTLQLHDETYYWGEMLGSVWYSGLYAVQKSPAQFCRWTKDACVAQTYQGAPSITARWTRFYQIARQSAWKLGGHSIRAKLLSPIRSSRAEMRQKRDLLLEMKDLHTSSLGLVMEGWHLFEANDSASLYPGTINAQWCDAIHRAVVLIEAIFQQIALEPSTHELEQGVLATLERDINNIGMHTQGGIQCINLWI
ncbi:Nuclear control of ATP synthase 2 [Penicillium concentricum]|uniref:Nuclear control of ATP synthase 2 n=1 Tax=Penicillium concentricum TaxID=293559 RepID=A0A9W9RRE3_9EURO|nr:Nuclear control of ATP synthase 2 [Penicillium concentricum]KAJ5365017.1 Nuclear control of ATP synthase 2 [Penicillium concentricum]